MSLTAITVGIAVYPHQQSWALAEAANARQKVEHLFRHYGAQHENWTSRATRSEINVALEQWQDRIEESHIIYWIGHGEYDGEEYHAALADSTNPMNRLNSLTVDVLAGALRNQASRRTTNGFSDNWVLLILDTCGSGEGAWELWRSFGREPTNVGIIASTDEGASYLGAISTTLQHILDEGFTSNDSAGIPLADLMSRLATRIGIQRVRHSFTSAVLPLPADGAGPIQSTVDVYRELRQIIDAAPADVRSHFYAKAQGTEITELAWHFTGREAEREWISAWLRESPGGMFVVSGLPGSGKSALLGMLLATSDDAMVEALTASGHGPVPDALRPVGVVFEAILHLSGKTFAETLDTLWGALLPGRAGDLDALIEGLGSRRVGQLSVLVDALDEARDPFAIAAALRRLASLPGVRVLIGTRKSMSEGPDRPVAEDSTILAALTADHVHILRREPKAVSRYVVDRLSGALPEAYVHRVHAVSAAIAAYDQPFLFARLAVSEILADPAITLEPRSMTSLLDHGHSGIFEHAVARLKTTAPNVEALLHVLAYARGSGFPRTGGIWSLAASALLERPVDDTDVEATLNLAASFIMQDSEFGQSVYRLAHRTFTEWYQNRDSHDA